jgi:hypothetical protein
MLLSLKKSMIYGPVRSLPLLILACCPLTPGDDFPRQNSPSDSPLAMIDRLEGLWESEFGLIRRSGLYLRTV